MLSRFIFSLLIVLLLANPTEAQSTSGTRKPAIDLLGLSASFESLAEKVTPGIVQIFTVGYSTDSNPYSTGSLLTRQRSSGSGVIVDPSGYIVTNAHVVQGARRVQVLLSSDQGTAPGKSILKTKGKLVPAKIVGVDSETDLAVLKIQETTLSYLELGDSDSIRPGQLVLAFGSPFGLENSVTMGVVSAVARQLRPEDPMIYIQTDTPINPGNSGGPLVDLHGRVIGINTLILSQSGGSEGVGFAAPSNIVKNVFQQLKTTGRVHRGEIGISAQTITPSMAAGLDLPQNWGVIVGDVYPNSPAARSGIQVGDIIVSLDGKVVENGRQFDVNLYKRAEGDTVALEVLRGKERHSYQVPVIARSEGSERFARMITPEENVVPQLGLFCLEMNEEIARLIPGLRKGYGVVIAARMADAPYWAANFVPGDVIHAVNGQYISTLSQVKEKLAVMRSGDPVVLQIERLGQLQFVAVELE